MLKRMYSFVAPLLLLCFSVVSVSAASYEDMSEGTYYIDATLSCYINAMGGMEFGVPLLTSAQVEK